MKLAFLFNVAMMLSYIVTMSYSGRSDVLVVNAILAFVHAGLAGVCYYFMRETRDG